MAAGKAAASGGSFHRRRNQPDRENGEETGCNSNGHREAPTNRAASTSGSGLALWQPTMDSRGILLALDLENGKRPRADYSGGSDERCKYYSHGTR